LQSLTNKVDLYFRLPLHCMMSVRWRITSRYIAVVTIYWQTPLMSNLSWINSQTCTATWTSRIMNIWTLSGQWMLLLRVIVILLPQSSSLRINKTHISLEDFSLNF